MKAMAVYPFLCSGGLFGGRAIRRAPVWRFPGATAPNADFGVDRPGGSTAEIMFEFDIFITRVSPGAISAELLLQPRRGYTDKSALVKRIQKQCYKRIGLACID